MERSIPLWLFLLCLLLGLLFTIAFGWVVETTVSGSQRAGFWGRAAVRTASFPDTAKDVLGQISGYLSGNYRDKAVSVRRDSAVGLSGFRPVATVSSIDIPGLFMRADPTEIEPGWRVLAGAFQINGGIENAILLISPDLEVVRKWTLTEVPVGGLEPRPKYRKFVHGMEILRDGSVIVTFDGSVSLQKFSACGRREWAAAGRFNHAVTLDDAGKTVWTLSNKTTIAQVAVEDGSILRRISMDQIIASNPEIDILEIRRSHSNDLGVNSRNTSGAWLADPYHLNDVDPLPAAIADRFKGFDTGDLLISARSLNLIFVLDPETLKVKWWRIGAVQRQHDPDWAANGEITVLNNRMSRDFSEIDRLDPDTFRKSVMLDGRKYHFYTRIRGKHQLLRDGTLVVTSPQQGRAFEVAPDGQMAFELVNLKPGDHALNYVISELRWLPRDYFHAGTWQCPTSN